eukprot:CAMPEP_0119036086 /NCGR_PEP_ID=MMETSP1177-20130426/3553_1 /TAXON_ID=2985 /ORGANISM="Ochromonas sp, Strain CCMP1899" /LENGTH=449 /DNA_ID=CAMNT_0006995367 /DNA_START=209 /DNA_END=1555 /DNA_ORIENTATION=-
MRVESFSFMFTLTVIAFFSVTKAFQHSKLRFYSTNLRDRSNQHISNNRYSLQSVLENKESDFADIYNNEVAKKEQQSFDYNWKQQWYAVTYDFNLPTKQDLKPYAYSIFDQELTFWRDDQGVIRCSEDKCPHRNARLSEGSVENGQIECLYHGWKFDKSGDCVKIPQLLPDAKIPKQACVKMYSTAIKEGILWVWMDTPATADYNNIPTTQVDLDALNKKGWFLNNFQIDLPYDHSFLVENLLDPTHIPVSHDNTPGGGKKENAQPLIMKLMGDLHPKGFEGSIQNTRAAIKKEPILTKLLPFMKKKETAPVEAPPQRVVTVDFEAPGIVRYHSESEKATFGAAMHCMPLGRGRSRLLFTTFFKGPAILLFIVKLKPMWLRNLNSCKILEQDAGLITSQEDMLTKNTGTERAKIPAKEWLTMGSQDLLLVQYRKWLDIAGPKMPYYMGW